MSILTFANMAKFLFRKVFPMGTPSHQQRELLAVCLSGKATWKGRILAGSWNMARVWWGSKERAVLWGCLRGSQDRPLAWWFVRRTPRSLKSCYNHGLQFITVKGLNRLKSAKGKKHWGRSPGKTRYKLLGVPSQWGLMGTHLILVAIMCNPCEMLPTRKAHLIATGGQSQ